jgi:hypothetical protein
MPQYMLLIYHDDETGPQPESPEQQEEFQQYMQFTQEVRDKGLMLSGEPLEPTHTATTVQVKNGETVLSDGPFADTKEWLAGFYILDCPDLDTATEQAAKIPAARHGAVEVRPVMVLPEM